MGLTAAKASLVGLSAGEDAQVEDEVEANHREEEHGAAEGEHRWRELQTVRPDRPSEVVDQNTLLPPLQATW